MFCPRCGASLPDGSKFCTSCGATLDSDVPAAETQVQPTQLMPSPQPQPQPAPGPDQQQLVPSPQPPKRPGRGKVVAIVVLALLLAAALAVIVWQVVLPRLGGQQSADQPAQEQPAQPEPDEQPAPESAPEPTAPDTTAPEGGDPSQAATLEDYLRAAGQYDTVCDLMTQSLSQTGGEFVTDAQTVISGNAIEVHVAWNFSSTDAAAQAMEDAMISAYNSSGVASSMASSVQQFEAASGISGITVELYLYTSDGQQFGSLAYGSDGLVTSDASFEGQTLVS